MIGKRPDVLDSKYVQQDENGDYFLLPGAPMHIKAAFKEYEASLASDGFVKPEPLPPIPPLKK